MGARHMLGAALAAWVMVGCGTAEPEATLSPSLESATAEVRRANGPVLNGINPNGTLLNRMLVSVRYDGALREGMSTPLEEVWLEGSTFHGLMGAEELSGLDFQQMRFVGDLEDGTTVTLRIDSVQPGTGTEQDIWSYRVSYQEPTDGQWYPLCKAADGTPADAIPLEGLWDYRQGVAGGGSKIHDTTTFTFACEGAVLAKCVRYGYPPWRSVNGVSLADHHQACTRLLRADFCGDGTPHTVEGNMVNLYDTLNVQVDTENWAAEAEWTPTGAQCFTSQTRSTTPIQCADGRLVSTCGTSFSSGVLFISETPGSQP